MFSGFFLTLTPVVKGWLYYGNESQLKMLTNLHLLQMKTAHNSVLNIGTTMIFGRILEGVWPVNNQKKFRLRDFKCQNQSGITGFFKHLHYNIHKPSQ